ncbi:hypothetical protein M0R72_12015 [Candidatus Pacearchaeota archaeon]|jgi:hypothetical protein|nr:hypothetical protein [Candidatus Pacearchaeota archaeon]
MVNEQPKTVWDELEEESESGKFWKPVDGKQNIINIITDPIVGMTNFKKTDKPQKKQFNFIITTIEKPNDLTTWGMNSKPAMRAMRQMMKASNLTSLVGATIQVVASGAGFDRKYTILPVVLPTPATIAKVQAEFPEARIKTEFPELYGGAIPTA